MLPVFLGRDLSDPYSCVWEVSGFYQERLREITPSKIRSVPFMLPSTQLLMRRGAQELPLHFEEVTTSMQSQDPERHLKVPYPVLSTGSSHSLCSNVASLWKCATFQGSPLPSLDSRLLQRWPLSINDVWEEEMHIHSVSSKMCKNAGFCSFSSQVF